MKKLLLAAVPLALMLGACGQQITNKTTGQITSKDGCDSMTVSYKMQDGHYGVDSVGFDTYQECSQYQVGQKVTVYYNQSGIVEATQAK